MKRTLTILGMLAIMATIITAVAVPARRDPFTVTQPNGDSLTIYLVGDERWHANYTEDHIMIVQDEKGWWRYAQYTGETYTDRGGIERKAVKATRRKAHNEAKRCACEKRWIKRHGITR